MKSVIKKSILLLVFGALVLNSCTQEPVTSPEVESSLEVATKGGSADEYKITVEWYSTVTEEQKSLRRSGFARDGILISYVKCTFVPDTEVWTVLCPECRSDEDVPIKTDPCPDPTDTGKSSDTDPDPAEECDIKRVSPGVTCDI